MFINTYEKLVVPNKIEEKIKLEYENENAFAQINVVATKVTLYFFA